MYKCITAQHLQQPWDGEEISVIMIWSFDSTMPLTVTYKHIHTNIYIVTAQHLSYNIRKNTFLTCASNKDSNQPAHLRSLIRVFIACIMKLHILGYPNVLSEDTDLTAQMCRLIWIFVGDTCLKICFQTLRLISSYFSTSSLFCNGISTHQCHMSYIIPNLC